MPGLVQRHMVHLKTLFDVQSYTIRVAMMQVLGNIITGLLSRGVSSSAPTQSAVDAAAPGAGDVESNWVLAKPFYDILLERLRDKNSFVRCKVLQVLAKLTRYVYI
jgi:hypothetical protein